jgi:hypothetical protein
MLRTDDALCAKVKVISLDSVPRAPLEGRPSRRLTAVPEGEDKPLAEEDDETKVDEVVEDATATPHLL